MTLCIAVDSTNVYWGDTTSPSVQACAVGGCGGSSTTLASNQAGPAGFVSDGTNLYWTDYPSGAAATTSGAVRKCSILGCNNNPTVLAGGLDEPEGIAVDATSVYVAGYGNGTVLKVPIGGGTITTLVTGQGNAGAGGSPWAVAVDSTSVYWGSNSTIMKVTPK